MIPRTERIPVVTDVICNEFTNVFISRSFRSSFYWIAGELEIVVKRRVYICVREARISSLCTHMYSRLC